MTKEQGINAFFFKQWLQKLNGGRVPALPIAPGNYAEVGLGTSGSIAKFDIKRFRRTSFDARRCRISLLVLVPSFLRTSLSDSRENLSDCAHPQRWVICS